MNQSSQQKQALANRICGILRRHVEFAATPDEPDDVILPFAAERELEHVAEQLLETNTWLNRKYSVKYLHVLLKELASGVVRSRAIQNVGPRINELMNHLLVSDERKICLIPLQGVALTSPCTTIGRFTLKEMNEANLGDAISILTEHLDRNTVHSAEEKAGQKEWFLKHLREDLSGTVCLEVSVNAESHKAEQVALQEASMLLELLRYLIAYKHPKNDCAVGLKGDGQLGVYRRYILPAGESSLRFSASRPYVADLVLDEQMLKLTETLGIQRVAAPTFGATELENAVMKAIHWVAESQTQDTDDNRLLHLVIAVESIFATRDGGIPGTSMVAEMVALITELDLVHRERVVKIVTDAFRNRGQIVHQGVSAAESASVRRFRNVVVALIARTIDVIDQFTSPAHLREHIRNRRLSLEIFGSSQ